LEEVEIDHWTSQVGTREDERERRADEQRMNSRPTSGCLKSLEKEGADVR
jgi:hypothetical protein